MKNRTRKFKQFLETNQRNDLIQTFLDPKNDAYWAPVYRYYNCTAYKETIKDMVITRIMRGWKTFDPSSSGSKTWLRTIVRNETVTFLRSNKYNTIRGYAIQEDHKVFASGINAFETSETRLSTIDDFVVQCKNEIRKHWPSSKNVDRNIWIFEQKLAGTKEKAIANSLGLGRGTVASTWFRMRRLLVSQSRSRPKLI